MIDTRDGSWNLRNYELLKTSKYVERKIVSETQDEFDLATKYLMSWFSMKISKIFNLKRHPFI